MSLRKLPVLLGLSVCLMVIFTGHVSSVILEVTSLGTVSELNETENTLTITEPRTYGCEYSTQGLTNCSFRKSEDLSLTGTVPDNETYSLIAPGDQVVVTGYGGADGTFITIAKVVTNMSGALVVTDAIGVISSIPVPFMGRYEVLQSEIPDCENCSGTLCTASGAQVTIRVEGEDLVSKELIPDETLSYNGRNDGSMVNVTFVSGTAPSSLCKNATLMTGPQSVSDFIVSITPPIGEQEECDSSDNPDTKKSE